MQLPGGYFSSWIKADVAREQINSEQAITLPIRNGQPWKCPCSSPCGKLIVPPSGRGTISPFRYCFIFAYQLA